KVRNREPVMMVKDFFDKTTSTLSYVIYDDATKDAVIVDPVLDFDPASGIARGESALKIVHFLRNMELEPRMVLETHVHADHMSSSQTFKRFYPDVEVAISSRVTKVQSMFREILDLKGLKTDGSQ